MGFLDALLGRRKVAAPAKRDRLFAMFAAAFWILALQRLILTVTRAIVEDQAIFYTLRLLAFVIIIVAIVDKNRR